MDDSFLAFALIVSEPLACLRATSHFVPSFSYSDSAGEQLAGHFCELVSFQSAVTTPWQAWHSVNINQYRKRVVY